jgi:glycosyltransferase involved in cell wall biosynthesis
LKTICFISTNDWVPYGGSEVLWSEAALFLLKNYKNKIRVQVSTIKWEPTPNHINNLKLNGAEVYYKNKLLPLWYWRVYNRFAPGKFQVIKKQDFDSPILEKSKPDLVVFSLGDHNEVMRFDVNYCKKNGIPYVLIVQLVKDAHLMYDNQLKDLSNNYFGAKKVFFVSNQNKNIIEDTILFKLQNGDVISNPFPQQHNNLNIYPPAENGFNLAFIASLNCNHKGQDVLIKVLSQNKWRERNLTVNLYGKGPHKQYIKNLIEFYNVKNVIIKEEYKSLTDVWSLNHASILCSHFEGQSLALLESIAFNRMCIATNVGDASLLIEEGKTGFIAEAATFNLIDEVLEKAWDCRYEWKEMGERAGIKLKEIKKNNPIIEFCEKLLILIDMNNS